MDFYERTLISLKRQYSKDEVVAALVKKLAESETELGKLKAEIDYLQNELQAKIEIQEANKAALIQARKEKLYKTMLAENTKQKEDIKKLRLEKNDLIAMIASKTKAETKKVKTESTCGTDTVGAWCISCAEKANCKLYNKLQDKCVT